MAALPGAKMRLIPPSEGSVRDVVGKFTIRIDGDMLVALVEKKLYDYVVSTVLCRLQKLYSVYVGAMSKILQADSRCVLQM